jgi:hypothetical protein
VGAKGNVGGFWRSFNSGGLACRARMEKPKDPPLCYHRRYTVDMEMVSEGSGFW